MVFSLGLQPVSQSFSQSASQSVSQSGQSGHSLISYHLGFPHANPLSCSITFQAYSLLLTAAHLPPCHQAWLAPSQPSMTTTHLASQQPTLSDNNQPGLACNHLPLNQHPWAAWAMCWQEQELAVVPDNHLGVPEEPVCLGIMPPGGCQRGKRGLSEADEQP